jgi:hypothetical protein
LYDLLLLIGLAQLTIVSFALQVPSACPLIAAVIVELKWSQSVSMELLAAYFLTKPMQKPSFKFFFSPKIFQ